MGENGVRKSRSCKACGQSIHGDAFELRAHAGFCKRMHALGLVTSGLLVDGQASKVLETAQKRKAPRPSGWKPTMGGGR